MSGDKKVLGSGLLEIPTLESYIRTCVERAGLRVVFDDSLAPHTSKDTIYIPRPSANITQEDVLKLRHGVLHEALHHIKGPEIFEIGEENKLASLQEPLGSLLNVFEDGRIEREGARDYIGDKEILVDGKALFYSGFKDEHMARLDDPADKDKTMMGVALGLMNETDAEWNSADMVMKEKMQSSLPSHVKALLKRCKDEGITDQLKTSASCNESFEIAKRVYEMIYERSAEDHIKELKEQAAKEGKDGKEDKDGKPCKQGAGKQSDGDGDKKGKRFQDLCTKYLPQEIMDGVADPNGGGLHLDYTNYDKKGFNAFQPVTKEEIYLYDVKNKKDLGAKKLGGSRRLLNNQDDSWVRAYKNEANAKTLANRIRRHLQVKSQATWTGGMKRGKLSSRTAYRVACPRSGDGSWNARVFKQKTESDVLDVAVTVLVDYSGSMSGGKIRDAIKSSMILTECLSHGLRVPVEIIGFTEFGSDLVLLLIKQFDDRPSMDEVGKRMLPGTGCMANNNDGDAIMVAYDRLRRRKEKRKMMFVLSDGSPASGRGHGDCMEYTQKVVKKIEEEGVVGMYGIGIQDHNVKLIYKRSEVLGSSSELEDQLLKIVQRRIISEDK